jgi:hypothetical protein
MVAAVPLLLILILLVLLEGVCGMVKTRLAVLLVLVERLVGEAAMGVLLVLIMGILLDVVMVLLAVLEVLVVEEMREGFIEEDLVVRGDEEGVEKDDEKAEGPRERREAGLVVVVLITLLVVVDVVVVVVVVGLGRFLPLALVLLGDVKEKVVAAVPAAEGDGMPVTIAVGVIAEDDEDAEV